ncbi:hypothetical protein [Mycobacterium sp. URHB0044]|jgi:hypothetical protein|uniref:hypothetical protein n=1 Tax=Mycobacterium sp. URHB0044 TaxID=1380386 RepID=UPI0012DD1EDE|nr:hypothetical protein [Mycobacterium sp. URHB0044]
MNNNTSRQTDDSARADMNVDAAPADSRQFVAQHSPFWGAKVASITGPAWQKHPGKSYLVYVALIFAFCAVLCGLWFGLQSYMQGRAEWLQSLAGHGFQLAGLLVLFGSVSAWTAWSQRRKILISVTSDGLTVNRRPGDVYSFSDAKLGTWRVTGGMTMGTALHLYCGPRRFVLGGRDHRLASGVRLDAQDVGYGLPADIDAWLSAPEFEEILAMVGRRSALDLRPPTYGGPTICLLFPNPLLIQDMGSFAFRKRKEFLQSLDRPRLAIEVSPDAIRVVDPNRGALMASVSPAQVTATPVIYRPSSGHWIPTLEQLVSDLTTRYWSTTPGMHIAIPGMPPLTIGCRDTVTGLDRWFSWPDEVPTENAIAEYVVSGADWLTLTEKFVLRASANAP